MKIELFPFSNFATEIIWRYLVVGTYQLHYYFEIFDQKENLKIIILSLQCTMYHLQDFNFFLTKHPNVKFCFYFTSRM